MEKRIIKFRAFDLKGKFLTDEGKNSEGKPHMKYDDGVLGSHVRAAWVGGIDGLNIRPNSEDVMLMQFTGLHDKNGVEIYEGDIVSIIYNIPETEEGEEPKEVRSAIGFVDWNEHGTGWIIRTKSPLSFNDKGAVMTSIIHGRNGEREILGNIYSNPELI